jgi:hypothetical protein
MKIPLAIVLRFDVDRPEDAATVLAAIDPPHLPAFAGQARVVVGADVADLENWLDA